MARLPLSSSVRGSLQPIEPDPHLNDRAILAPRPARAGRSPVLGTPLCPKRLPTGPALTGSDIAIVSNRSVGIAMAVLRCAIVTGLPGERCRRGRCRGGLPLQRYDRHRPAAGADVRLRDGPAPRADRAARRHPFDGDQHAATGRGRSAYAGARAGARRRRLSRDPRGGRGGAGVPRPIVHARDLPRSNRYVTPAPTPVPTCPR